MKRLVGFVLAVVLVVSACSDKSKFTIDGKFENFDNLKKVVLYKGAVLVDSAILDAKGEFRFTVISPEADFYYISAAQKGYPIIAKNGDKINFKADFMNETGEYEISGSEGSEKLKDFNQISAKYGKIYMDIQKEYQEKVSVNPASKDSLEAVLIPRFERNMDDFAKETVEFANKNKDNLAGFYAMGSLDQTKYESELLQYAQSIKGKFPNVLPVQDFINKMDKLKLLAVGQPAPDFEMTSVDGSKLKLSQFRGQYLLLDFWASWCAPCRQENPNIVKQYNKFKDKQFTILGVSLDDNRDLWLKAIKDDNLTWHHVSELKQWDSNIVKEYSIEGIPTSYLLDKEGKIIAKNLRAEQLEEFLAKTLN